MHETNLHQLKPISPACARNRDPILSILIDSFSDAKNVLEVGSGTGEHGVYFAQHMPWLNWQCSDIQENLSGIQAWVDDAMLENLPSPIELDVSRYEIRKKYDAVFSANTLHIISTSLVEDFFRSVSNLTSNNADLVIYGPFNYDGKFTSDSNAEFEIWLKERDPLSGIRDFEWINELANNNGFNLFKDHAMPANNRCLHWKRQEFFNK